jgi:ethanolamine ammonia-lyase small subunit
MSDTHDLWQRLRALTAARVALGNAGASIPTCAWLDFQLDYARARDSVHHALATSSFIDELKEKGYDALPLHSAAADRASYLRRPDLGRVLDDRSGKQLMKKSRQLTETDVAIVIADGLSALAVERHAIELLDQVIPSLMKDELVIAPLVIVEEGRVAIGDQIGEILGARIAIVLIGERPGLSSPDSLGVYLTYAPRRGRTDAERNCISNIRPEGLSYDAAASTLLNLIHQSLKRQLSGVALNSNLLPA